MVTDIKKAVSDVQQLCRSIREQVAVEVVGQSEVIEQMLIAMLCEGHCLLPFAYFSFTFAAGTALNAFNILPSNRIASR